MIYFNGNNEFSGQFDNVDCLSKWQSNMQPERKGRIKQNEQEEYHKLFK